MTTNYAGYGLSEPQLHAILDFINATVTGGGGVSTLAALTDITTFNFPAINTATVAALAGKAPTNQTGTLTSSPTAAPVADTVIAAIANVSPLAPLVVTAAFTFAKATHANRRIDYNSAAAANLTFDGTAAYTTDDGNRLMQCGAGALTLLASGVTFANPKSLPLTTTGIGTYIDMEWDATIGQLTVTSVGAQPATISGTAAAPGIPMAGYPTTGFWISGAQEMSYGLSGSRVTTWDSGGNFRLAIAGAGLRVAENAAHGMQGAATLVAGSVVVSHNYISATSRILVTSQADGGTPGFLRVSTRVVGTSFTITSSSATDTSTVAYQIFEPA